MRKSPKTRPNILSLYFVSVSLTGLFLLAALTIFSSTTNVSFPWQKPVVGAAFGLICLLGITVGISPSKCSRTFHFRQGNRSDRALKAEQTTTKKEIITFEGHHPNCGNFSAHIFELGGKKYCAGCVGLVSGAVISLFGTLVFLLSELFSAGVGVVSFWFGLLGVTFGLLQYHLNVRSSFVHLFLNVVFVFGALLLLVGIEEKTSNLVLEAYFLLLTLFWVLTRIMLSQQEHRRICAACRLKPCGFLE